MPRGRPKGSLGTKKLQEIMAANSSQRSLRSTVHEPRQLSDSEEFNMEDELADRMDKAVERAIRAMSEELRDLKKDLREEFKVLEKDIAIIKKENKELKETCRSLDEKVSELEKNSAHQYALLNRQERFSRKNNVRLVGYKTGTQEDCIEIARSVFLQNWD